MLNILLNGKVVGNDPTQKLGQSGKPYTIAKVAAPQDGDEPCLANVIAFGAAAEKLAALKKGDPVAIVGRAAVQAWLDKTTNEPRGGLRVVAEQLLTPYQIQRRRAKPDPGGEAT